MDVNPCIVRDDHQYRDADGVISLESIYTLTLFATKAGVLESHPIKPPDAIWPDLTNLWGRTNCPLPSNSFFSGVTCLPAVNFAGSSKSHLSFK